jgi:hypothetical protein
MEISRKQMDFFLSLSPSPSEGESEFGVVIESIYYVCLRPFHDMEVITPEHFPHLDEIK